MPISQTLITVAFARLKSQVSKLKRLSHMSGSLNKNTFCHKSKHISNSFTALSFNNFVLA